MSSPVKHHALLLTCTASLAFGCASGDQTRPAPASLTSGATSGATEADDDANGTSTGNADLSSTGSSSTTEPALETESSGSEESTGDGATTGSTGDEPSASTVVFLNFEGVTLMDSDTENAETNAYAVPEFAQTWSGAPPARVQDFVDGMESLLSPFPIQVTTTRPAAGPYTMVVITADEPPISSTIVAFATVDCGNLNPSNIVLAFDTGIYPTTQVVNAAGAGLGSAFGLSRNDAPNDVMHIYASDEPAEFSDACVQLDEFPDCDPATLSDACGAGLQNTAEELRIRLR